MAALTTLVGLARVAVAVHQLFLNPDAWPAGPVEDLKWVNDWGSRTLDRSNGVWDPNAGRDRLEAQIGDSSCAIFTLNGPASIAFTAGSRGPPPTV